MDHFDEFTLAYLVCALWSTNDESTEQGGDPLDKNYGIDNIDPATLARMVKDCADFQAAHAEHLVGYPLGRAGHDFWLTRNHHGCGFWENDFGTEAGSEALTDACHALGEVDLYVGDDKKIYA